MKLSKTKVHDFKYTIHGEYGYARFEIDSDNNLILIFRDGQRFVRSLEVELTLPGTKLKTVEKYVAKTYQKIRQNIYNGVIPE